MLIGRPITQLQHFPENGPRSAGPLHRAQRLERSADGVRVGVVGVVDHGDAPRRRLDIHAPATSGLGTAQFSRDVLTRHAARDTDRRGRQGGRDEVFAVQQEVHGNAVFPGHRQVERGPPLVVKLDPCGMDPSGFALAEPHHGSIRLLGHGADREVVTIQHSDTIRRQGPH